MATTAKPREVSVERLRGDLLRAGRKVVADDSGDNRKALATLLVDLREQYTDKDGQVDYSGRSQTFRDAMEDIYNRIGMADESEHKAIRTGVRYHVQKIVRERLRAQAGGDETKYRELCRHYGLKPQHADDVRKARLAADRVAARGLLTAEDAVIFLADTREKAERFLKTNNLDDVDAETAASLRDEASAIVELLAPVVAALASPAKVAEPTKTRRRPSKK